MKVLRAGFLAIALSTVGVGSAYADHFVGVDVPAALIVVDGGLEWAYANPCSPTGCPGLGGVLGPLGFGWVVAPAAAWNASSWNSGAEVAAAFAGKCASAYFDDDANFDHCDFGDTAAGFIHNFPGAPDPNTNEETFVVRRAVPEPASLALLGAGLAGLAAKVRRRRRKN